jgi:outer membrane protein assembly factor BamB
MILTRVFLWGVGGWALILWAGAARGGDWPQWGGTDVKNMMSVEKGLPDLFEPGEKSPQGLGIDMATTRNVSWVVRLGSQTYGNPTISNGRVFVGTNDDFLDDPRLQPGRGGLIKCFDEASGKLLWQLVIPRFETKDKLFNYDNLDLGICSSPTVDGDRVYLVTNRGEVLCLDVQGMANGNDGPFQDEGRFMVPSNKSPVAVGPQDGDIIWRFDMLHELPAWPQDATSCSILVHGDLLYVSPSNGVDRSHEHVPFPDAPSLIVLDKRTGRMVARDMELAGHRMLHGEWSSPALGMVNGRPLVFYGEGDGLCYAFEALASAPDKPAVLKKVWSFDCNPPEYRFRDGQPIAYRAGDVRKKRGNTNDGTYVGPSEIIATPVFYKNRIYVAIGQDPLHGRGRGMLNCIDATKTGDISRTGKVWSYDKLDRSLSTVSIADGLLYIADFAGVLHCLDAETGQCYWTYPTKAQIWGSTLVADGKVYLGNQKALWIFAAGKELRLLGEIHLGSPVYCTPVVANGVLYVATHRYMWAVKAPSMPAAAGQGAGGE